MARSIFRAWGNAHSIANDTAQPGVCAYLRGIALSGMLVLGSLSGASAATIPGQSVVLDNGDGSFTFGFNLLAADIVETGLSFTNGIGIDFVVSGSDAGGGAANVVQSATPFAGLGVDQGPGVGNIGAGEALTFAFGQNINLLGITLNGRYADAATGSFSLASTGASFFNAPAGNFDGVGLDAAQQGSMCFWFDFLCNTNQINLTSGMFNGFVDTITVEIAPAVVPVPASGVLLGAGLAGLVGMRRRRGQGDT